MRILVRVFGKELLLVKTGEPYSMAPDFTTHPVGFSQNPIPPRELTIPDRE